MKQTKTHLMTILWSDIAAALLLVALFETDCLEPGLLAGLAQLEFGLMMCMELLTIAAIPLALKLFKLNRVHSQLLERKEKALMQWGTLRLLLLTLPMVADTFLYYMFQNTTFGYLAIISALCIPFVYPTMNRCIIETTE